MIILMDILLVLLYYLNCTHYPVRSGGPSNGDVSGAFLYLVSHTNSLTYWDNGAALS